MAESSILLATSNPHKLDEVRAGLEPLGCTVLSLDDVSGEHPEPVEDADTFEGNARLKAVGYAGSTGMQCLADDSGLEVDVLDPLARMLHNREFDPQYLREIAPSLGVGIGLAARRFQH